MTLSSEARSVSQSQHQAVQIFGKGGLNWRDIDLRATFQPATISPPWIDTAVNFSDLRSKDTVQSVPV